MKGLALVAAAALVAAGCGGASAAPRIDGPFGKGRGQFWVVRAKGKPKAVVAVLHGLSQNSGLQLRPWLLHLASQGDDVIYPRYEQPAPAANARDGVVEGVRAGLAKLDHPQAKLVLVGHSRGGRLAVEAAASLKPAGVVAVFPGQINPAFEPSTDFTRIPSSTQIWLLVGDRDEGVGNAGALELYERLRTFDFPTTQIHGGTIASTKTFTADHMSVYRTSPGARKAIWARVDRLVRQAVGA